MTQRTSQRLLDDDGCYLGARNGDRRFANIGPYPLLASGKVRDVYTLDAERLLFVTSDRVSAFDVLMDRGVPSKGRVLTKIAAHWFERTRDIIENHLLATHLGDVADIDPEWREALDGRVMVVRRAQPTPVEWVVRAYLAGSGFAHYREHGDLFGQVLPQGLELASALPEPLLTPTTKDDAKDLPISLEQARALVGNAVFERARDAAFALFARAADRYRELGLVLADTKFEFGLAADDGRVLLIDEALTPDSSRLWEVDAWRPGSSPPSFDKQILRDWLEQQPWNKRAPAPRVTTEVIERLRDRYGELCRRLTESV